MPDPVVEAAVEAAVVTPAADKPAESQSTPAASAPEEGSLESAVATYKAAKAENEKAAAPAAEPATGEAKPGQPAEPAKKPEEELDAELPGVKSHVLSRLTALEKERDEVKVKVTAAEKRAADLEARAKRADELEGEKKKFLENPDEFFKSYGWDQETLRDYVVNGPKAAKPELSRVERETHELKERLAKFERDAEERSAREQISAAKSRIPAILQPEAEKFPILHSYFDQPGEMADAVFAVIEQTYQEQKTQLTVQEAAKAIEETLSAQLKRLSRASSKTAEPSTKTPAPKQATPTLTNVPPGSSGTKTNSDDSDDARFEAALAILKQSTGKK
jgi:hypothetical protein